jgi:hypothetical protein
MKQVTLFLAWSLAAEAADKSATHDTAVIGSHSWLIRCAFIALIVLFAVFWAVKNRFTDYP